MGKIEAQQKLIDEQGEAIVRLGQDRDAIVAVASAATAAYREKFTTPLRARLDEATAKVEALKKAAETAKLIAAKAQEGVVAAKAALRAAAAEAEKAAAASRIAAGQVAAAEKAYGEARSFTAVFSFSYFSRKKQTESALAEARAALASARQAEGRKIAALAHAEANVAAANQVTDKSVAAHVAAEKLIAPASAEVAAVTKERSKHVVEREKLAAPGVAAEKDYAAKLPALQASLQKAKEGLPVLEKALVAVRAQLAEAAKPVEAKRLLVEAAAKTLELTKSEKANAEKALAAAVKDIPQRDKNLEEIAKSYAELTPQVEPMKAKVKASQEQYFAMLPKREEGKKN
jgi:hypothetical protein